MLHFKLPAHFFQYAWNDQLASWAVFFKRPQRAIALYEASLALGTRNTAALLHAKSCLANLYASQNQATPALKLMSELVEQSPNNADFAFNLGYLHSELGAPKLAQQAFLSAIALNDNHDRAWYGLALIYIEQNRLLDAQSALEKNTQIQPMSPYGWYQLAMVQQQLGRPKTAQKTLAHLRSFEPKFARGLASDLQRLSCEASPKAAELNAPEKTVQNT